MPYIPAIQRYGEASRVSPRKQDTNASLKKMDRNCGYYDTAPWVNRTSLAQPSYLDQHGISNSYYRPSQAVHLDYGSARSRSPGREDRSSQSGCGDYGGYEQAGYREAFYGRGFEGRSYQCGDRRQGQKGYEQIYQTQAPLKESTRAAAGRWYQPGYQGDAGDYYTGQQNQTWQPRTASYYTVYSTAPANQGFYHPDYRQQQYVQPQHYMQYYAPYNYAQCQHAQTQPWLTQQWEAVNEVPPPPPSNPSSGFNRNAPAFRPQLKSVSAADLNQKYRIDKKSRYDGPNKSALRSDTDIPPPPPPSEPDHDFEELDKVLDGQSLLHFRKKRGNKGRSVEPEQSASGLGSRDVALRESPPYSSRSREPKQYLLPRPQPSSAYMEQASKYAIQSTPRPLLVVLDLNGTLLYRKRRGSNFLARPKVNEFLHYLLTNHHVMVWSSARPDNVEAMCKKLFTESQYQMLIAVWARDKLRIPPQHAGKNIQVYKQLSWIWKDKHIQSQNPNPVEYWSQENTVLIDDNMEKAASEQHSLIQLEEFEARQDQMDSDVLGQVVKYLEKAKAIQDVSTYIHMKPFAFDPKASFDWKPIINDMH